MASNERFGWAVSLAAAECHTRLLEVARLHGVDADHDGWVTLSEQGALATAIGCSLTGLKGYLAELRTAGLVETERPSLRAPLRYRIAQPAAVEADPAGAPDPGGRGGASRPDRGRLSGPDRGRPRARFLASSKTEERKTDDSFVVDDGAAADPEVLDDEDDEVLVGEVLDDEQEDPIFERLLARVERPTTTQRQELLHAYRESPRGFANCVEQALNRELTPDERAAVDRHFETPGKRLSSSEIRLFR